MNTETGLVNCIEKMIERIVGKETYERNRRHKSRDRYFSGHDRWENFNHSHSRFSLCSKLSFDMSKVGDSARCGECGKTSHLVENCPSLSEQEREIYRLHNLQYVEYFKNSFRYIG